VWTMETLENLFLDFFTGNTRIIIPCSTRI